MTFKTPRIHTTVQNPKAKSKSTGVKNRARKKAETPEQKAKREALNARARERRALAKASKSSTTTKNHGRRSKSKTQTDGYGFTRVPFNAKGDTYNNKGSCINGNRLDMHLPEHNLQSHLSVVALANSLSDNARAMGQQAVAFQESAKAIAKTAGVLMYEGVQFTGIHLRIPNDEA